MINYIFQILEKNILFYIDYFPQMLFYCGLFLSGLIALFPLKRKLGFPFLCITSFLFGSTFWVIGALLHLCLTVKLTMINMTVWMIVVTSITFLLNYKKYGFHFERKNLLLIFTGLALILLVSGFFIKYNHTNVTGDSTRYVMYGRTFTIEGNFLNKQYTYSWLTDYGVFIIMLQSASVLLGQDYLIALPMLFSFSIIMLFIYTCNRLTTHTLGKFNSYLSIGLFVVILLTTKIYNYHSTYIHSNLASAAYLFTGFICFWLAFHESESAWFIPGSLAFLGFNLMRTETMFFTLMVLVIFLAAKGLSFETYRKAIYPLLISMLFWSIQLFSLIGIINKTLTLNLGSQQEFVVILDRTFLLFSALIIVILASGLSLPQLETIRKKLFPLIPILFFTLGLILFIFLKILKPNQVFIVFDNTLTNIFSWTGNPPGYWGFFGLIMVIILVTAFVKFQYRNEEIIITFIGAFFFYLFLVGFIGSFPYRVSSGDSGNRMLLHIAPIILIYVYLLFTKTISPGVFLSRQSSQGVLEEERP